MPNAVVRFALRLVALVIALLVPGRALAVMDATTECLFEYDGVPTDAVDGGTIECTDCDPACDADGVSTANGSCTFAVAACLNQARPPLCVAAASVTGKVRPKKAALSAASPCGPDGTVLVKTKRNGKRAGRIVLVGKAISGDRPRRVDVDRLTLICQPNPGACPTTTTTTGTSPGTTSTIPATTTTSVAATTTTSAVTTTTTVATTTTIAATTTTTVATTTTTSVEETTTTSVEGTTTTSVETTSTLGTTTSIAETTTTTTVEATTTTTEPAATCEPILAGQPIANTYNILGVAGQKMCHTNSTVNKFQPCTTDADCGGQVGTCIQAPWVTADGITLPFPIGVSTTFTVATPGAAPGCSHDVCISCGNPSAACPGLPGCQPPLSGFGCAKTTCCDQPGFTVPTFAIPSVGQCVRVDQIGCGVGVVNTSNPQTGDNDVKKSGDTSDPGPDCAYGAGDPAAKPCNSAAGGAGADSLGKITRTLGNGSADSTGIHYRFLTPMMATAWTGDVQGCPPGATFDGAENGELVSTQVILQAEPTTAGATGQFSDLVAQGGNGDGCALAGAGFSGPGPNTLAPPALAPMPYGGGPSVAGSAGVALSGGAPLFDLGFVVVLPNATPTVVAGQSCSCTVTPGCPE